jgi:DNA-binding beta-propeller fold protein YncE
VSDFIAGLREDLVDAAARERRRGGLGRGGVAWHLRSWRPAAAVGAMAVAVSIAAIALAVVALAPPSQRAGRPHVVAVVRVGGSPVGAAFGDGSLWVADFRGTVARVDPATGRVRARIHFAGQPQTIAAGRSGVWVRTPDANPAPKGGGLLASHLLRIDPRTNHVVARIGLGGGDGLAVGPDAVWAARRFTMPEGIDRIDPRRASVTARIGLANVDVVAQAAGRLWAIQHDGTVVEVDAATGHVVRRWPQLAPSAAGGTAPKLAVDGDSVWVLSTVNAQIVRIEAGRVVQRIAVDPAVAPLLAGGRDGLWIATGDALGHNNRVMRLDPDTGKVTATLTIADHRPTALVAAGRTIYVVTADGRALVVRS